MVKYLKVSKEFNQKKATATTKKSYKQWFQNKVQDISFLKIKFISKY